MVKQKVNKSRRGMLSTTMGLSAVGFAMPASWTKPLVNSVILPAHAEGSVICPTVVVGAVEISVGASNGLCSLIFEFLSASTTPLTITSITNTATTATSDVTYDDAFPVDVTDSDGTRVTWAGSQTSDVNCAVGFTLLSADADVTFTVNATCENGVAPISVDFLLSDIAAML